MSLYTAAFSAGDQHILSSSHWAQHFLAIFRKVHESVQNSIFSRRSAHFVIFAWGATFFSYFPQSARVCTKQRFQPEMSTLLSFWHWAHQFLALFSKAHEFVQRAFSAIDQNVWSFSHLVPSVLAIFSKENEFLPNSISSRISARFSAKGISLSKTAFSARHQHVLSFSHWAHHFF